MFTGQSRREIGETGVAVGPLGFGTLKFGRNTGVKYPTPFDLPGDETIGGLLDACRDLGINLLDTAAGYGTSEARLGEILASRGDRDAWVISTKAGEDYDTGESVFDFSPEAIVASCERSLLRLGTDRVECLLLHSDGVAEHSFAQTGVFDALDELKARGLVRAVGASIKTPEGAAVAIPRCDLLMIEYSFAAPAMGASIDAAGAAGVGVFLKKVLGSGRVGGAYATTAEDALAFVFEKPAVSSVLIGTLSTDHLRQNAAAAAAALGAATERDAGEAR
jgi:aryl-alcohol dehydrogenase-like predicted oxidoreductase